MRLAILFSCIFGFAIAAQAQTVQVRSGEHDTFSRLTVTLPNRMEWEIEPTKDGARLVFNAPRLTLDTSEIYVRIPRNRISDVKWNGAEKALQLSFDCTCEATAFWHGKSMLVLDVRETPEKVETQLTQTRPQEYRSISSPLFESQRLSSVIDLSLAGLPDVNLQGTEAAKIPTTTLKPEVRDRLLLQVGRAASQGLLSPSVDRPEPRDAASSSESANKPETSVPDHVETTQASDHVNLKAQSSIDRDFLGSHLAQQQNLAASGCLADRRIDVGSWGNDDPFGDQISKLRLKLTGEFDAVNTKVAEQLVRLYLYFGFGVEARNLMNLMPPEHTDTAILIRLTRIAEDGHAGVTPFAINQLSCASPAALWAALSFETLPIGVSVDTDAILRAFNGLPDHLRAHYGPILAQRFIHANRPEIAAKLLRILDRNEDTRSPKSDMVSADLLTTNGDEEKADQTLQDVVASNAEPSTEALVQMIDQRFDSMREISFELAQLAGAYAFEHQDDEAGSILARAYVRALVASGAVDQAFSEFERIQAQLQPGEMVALQSDLLHRLAHQPEDIPFLRYTLPITPEQAGQLRPDVANAMADRLLALGFSDQAATFVARDLPQGHSNGKDRQLLRAQLALRDNKPRQAIVEMLGMVGADANLLQAKARSMVGEHSAAYHLYVAAGQSQKAQRQAWLGDNWAEAAVPGDPVFASLATLMNSTSTEEPTTSTDSIAVLAQNRNLVEGSLAMRSTFDALLNANPAPSTSIE